MKNNLDLAVYLVTDRLIANLSFEQLLIKVEQACRGGVARNYCVDSTDKGL